MLSPRLTLAFLLAAALLAVVAGQQQQSQQEQLVADESSPQAAASSSSGSGGAQVSPVLFKKVLTELVNSAYQMGQSSRAYLDTQPEFTQAWADFPYAPGYLAAAFRSSHTPYQQQQGNYKAQGSVANPKSVGYGYVDWSGPVNPAVLYVPVALPYYYRVPPMSAAFSPQQASSVYAQPKPIVYAAPPQPIAKPVQVYAPAPAPVQTAYVQAAPKY